MTGRQLERKLYIVRKLFEKAVAAADVREQTFAYLPSLSCNTLIYKGMLSADQIESMYPDVTDPDVESALALVHQRFSTNTFPSWPLAHPYRYVAHNGEINTLRGNINWMRAREALCRSSVFGDELWKVLPVTRDGLSDSATFDNVLEFLVMSGRSLPHAILMMIPEPWQKHESMSPERRAFYEYHSALMEPWDGPASIAFTDGTVIGAILDRNGLRPSRYYVTKGGLVVMASEVGVLDIPAEEVLIKERLHPGRIFLVDTARGRIVDDAEIKAQLAAEHPYADWLRDNLVQLADLPKHKAPVADHDTVLQRQIAFGYTHEDLRILLAPMASKGEEALGSMGTDTALAVLSNRPRPLYDYFKQLFAQVTNPPLDQIREELVTSMESTIGPEGNLLEPRPESCRQIVIPDPVLSNGEVARIRHMEHPWFKATTLPMLYPVAEGAEGLARALEGLQAQASQAIAGGHNVLILSDRGISREQAAIPSLLATGAVHHHLTRRGERTRVGLVLETGDAREVHHMCLLIGYGAGAVNPWVAFQTLDEMIRQGLLPGIDHRAAVKNYIKALNKGILKVMAKMGISALQSYCGAQIFEAIGLDKSVVDRYFTGTLSRVSGIGLDVIAEEARQRHERAFPARPVGPAELDWGGEYQWRRDGEFHLFNPETVQKLQHATRSGQYQIFKEYTRAVDEQGRNLRHPPGALLAQARRDAAAARPGRAGRVDHAALRDGRHVLRLDQPGGPRDARHRDEPDRRQVEHRRGRRGLRAVSPRGERRLAAERDPPGGVGALRRDQRVPRELRRSPDQDGPGRQARRGRAASGPQGLSLDRQGAALDARRGPDLTSAASRHLLDRGSEAADPRPEEREPPGAHPREAGGRGRRGHGGGGRGQGVLGRGADLGPRRRDGRVAADVDQARGRPLGARPRRDPAGARPQQAARPHRRPGGRAAEDGARRRHRRAARRRGVRLRHRAAGRHGLRDDAGLPPQHVPRRHRDPGPRAPQALRGRAGVRHDLLPVHRRGGPGAHGPARLPDRRRDDRPGGPPGRAGGGRPLEGARPGLLDHPPPARTSAPTWRSAGPGRRTTGSSARWT